VLFIPGDEEDLDCSSEQVVSSELNSTIILSLESLIFTIESLLILKGGIGLGIDDAPDR
jgi:hypothetical protein